MIEEILPGLTHVPNIHPLTVHFPIVLWLTALLFWVIGLVRDSSRFYVFGRWLLYLGTISAVGAVATGLQAADQIGHDSPGHTFVHTHRDFMLVASAFAVLVTGASIMLRNKEQKLVKLLLVGALGITNGVVFLGADRGAELVFRYGIGVSAEAVEQVDTQHMHSDSNKTSEYVMKSPHGHSVSEESVDSSPADHHEGESSGTSRHKEQAHDHDHNH